MSWTMRSPAQSARRYDVHGMRVVDRERVWCISYTEVIRSQAQEGEGLERTTIRADTLASMYTSQQHVLFWESDTHRCSAPADCNAACPARLGRPDTVESAGTYSKRGDEWVITGTGPGYSARVPDRIYWPIESDPHPHRLGKSIQGKNHEHMRRERTTREDYLVRFPLCTFRTGPDARRDRGHDTTLHTGT